MPLPVLTTTAARLYESLDPLVRDVDEANDWAGAHFCASLAAMVDQVADLVSDQEDGSPGYTLLFDPGTAPAEYLPWLARSAGADLPPELDEAAQRAAIANPPERERGTPDTIKAAPVPYLSGTQLVTLYERTDDSAYRAVLITYQAQTTDENAVRAAVLAEKPAGLLLTYRNDPGWSIGQMETFYDGQTVADLEGDWATLNDLETHLP